MKRLLLACLLAVFVAGASAQTTAPATAPATQRAPKMEQTPPGFVRVSAGRFNAFCLPGDQAWVKQALEQSKATVLPSTRPADILARVPQQRDAIANGLAKDLGLDPRQFDPLFDEQLLPELKKLSTVQPPVVFFVATETKVKELINSGWENPRVGLNRVTDKLRFDDTVRMNTEGVIDETMIPALYEPADAPAERAKKLRDAAERFESDVAFSVATRARVVTQIAVAQFLEKLVFVPLNLRDDQSWLQMGVVTYLAARYTPMLTGADPDQALADIIYERPGVALTSREVNLLELPSLQQVKPEFRGAYINAARRKSTLAVKYLADKAGPEAIRKALTAVQKNPPRDGRSMVAQITGATEIDLTSQLLPGAN